jgi:AcrR family transcriptional regulator
MPKVLPEYLAQRRQQILDAAAECFSEKGFHQTSMQDICERSELSPGAIYRYFKGKDEIIAGICDHAHSRDLELIESIKGSGNTAEVMQDLALSFLGALGDEQVRLHIDMLAEVPRTPSIQATMRDGLDAIQGSFAAFIRIAQERGDVSPAIDPDAMARVMCALYNGYIVQQQIDPCVNAEPFIEAVWQLFEGGFFTDPQSVAEERRARARR